jgi:hypothetical protein
MGSKMRRVRLPIMAAKRIMKRRRYLRCLNGEWRVPFLWVREGSQSKMVPKGHNQLHQALPKMMVKNIMRLPSEIKDIQVV